MQRKFLTNLLLVVVLNLLVKPFYILGIDAEVQNRVGEEIYGNYFSLLNFSFLLNILLDFGITNWNTRNIAQNPQLVVKHFSRILSLRFLLFILYAGFTLTAGFLVGYSGDEFYLLSILLVNQFLVAIIQFSRSNFAGLHKFRTDSLISVLDRSLLIIICTVLLWTNIFGGEFKIEWFIYAQTLAYGISALIALGLLWRETGRIKFQIQKTFSAMIIRQSFPYALLILLMMMYNRIDAVMLERMLKDGNEQAGYYAQGFRILDAVNMFALLFAGLLLPIFSRLLKKGEEIREMMELAFRILIGISIIVSLSAWFYGDFLMDLRYPDLPEISHHTFGFLILSFIPVCTTYIFGTLLTANGSLKALNIMAFSGVVLNVALNLILIPDMKAEGAAIATLVTQSVTALVQLVLAYRILNMKVNLKLFTSVTLLAALLFGSQYLISEYSELKTSLSFLLLLLAGLFIALALKIFKPSDIRTILVSERSENEDE